MARLLAMLLIGIVFGGAGAIFLWSTVNLLATGDAGWLRIVLTVPVGIGVLGILAWIVRFVRDFEPPKS